MECNKTVFLGPFGSTFSYVAYNQLARMCGLPDASEESYIKADTNDEVLNLIIKNNAYGVLAMDASRGRVIESLDSFLELLHIYSHNKDLPIDVKVAKKVRIPVCLMARPGVSLDSITGIMGHRKGLAVCANNLLALGKPTTEVSSNGEAAHLVAESDEHATYAAVAPIEAAKKYNLVVLHEGFEDQVSYTTFFFIGPKTHRKKLGKDNRALIVYKIPSSDDYGTLIRSLQPFSDEKLSLSQTYNIFGEKGLDGKDEYFFCAEVLIPREKIANYRRAMKVFNLFIKEKLVFLFQVT